MLLKCEKLSSIVGQPSEYSIGTRDSLWVVVYGLQWQLMPLISANRQFVVSNRLKGNRKASHTCYRALGPELIPVDRHSARSHPPAVGFRLPNSLQCGVSNRLAYLFTA